MDEYVVEALRQELRGRFAPEAIRDGIAQAARYELGLLNHGRADQRPPSLFHSAVKAAVVEFLRERYEAGDLGFVIKQAPQGGSHESDVTSEEGRQS